MWLKNKIAQYKNYKYGVQLTSFYQPGSFIPHVRMMETGRQNPALGCEFGLPYVYVRTPRISDQATLNYCWQLAGTQAYSLYARLYSSTSPSTTSRSVFSYSRMGDCVWINP